MNIQPQSKAIFLNPKNRENPITVDWWQPSKRITASSVMEIGEGLDLFYDEWDEDDMKCPQYGFVLTWNGLHIYGNAYIFKRGGEINDSDLEWLRESIAYFDTLRYEDRDDAAHAEAVLLLAQVAPDHVIDEGFFVALPVKAESFLVMADKQPLTEEEFIETYRGLTLKEFILNHFFSGKEEDDSYNLNDFDHE